MELPVSAGAAEDWHQTVRLRAEALNTPPEVAEAHTDKIDCAAAKHGQRIHMSHASMADNTWRRTSFPSRPSIGREATPSGSHKPPLVWGEDGVPPRRMRARHTIAVRAHWRPNRAPTPVLFHNEPQLHRIKDGGPSGKRASESEQPSRAHPLRPRTSPSPHTAGASAGPVTRGRSPSRGRPH